MDNTKFHGDESFWISTSLYFDLLINGDIHSKLWEPQYWTLTQPPVTRYIIGISRKLNNYGVDKVNKPWKFDKDKKTNIKEGNMPSKGLLHISRITMAILAVLSIATVFCITRVHIGPLVSYVLYIMLIINPYLLLQLTRAMSESPLLFFIMLAMLSLVILGEILLSLNRRTLNKYQKMIPLLFCSASVGFLTGLAGATKLNGFSLIVVSILLLAINLFISTYLKGISIRIRILLFSILFSINAITSVITFIGINPFLYKNSINRSIALFKWRIKEMNKQAESQWSSNINRFGFVNRIIRISNNVFNNYASIRFKGAFILNIIFFLTGFYIVLQKSWKFINGYQSNLYFLVLLLMSIIVAGPSLLTILDWHRYFYLPVFFSTILISIGIAEILRYLYNQDLVRKFTTPRPSPS